MKILFFGPNGSGKGTQGAIVKEKYGIPHIETGVIFRDNISRGTDLGKAGQGLHRPRRAGARQHHHPHDPRPAQGGGLQERLAAGRFPQQPDPGRGAGQGPQEGRDHAWTSSSTWCLTGRSPRTASWAGVCASTTTTIPTTSTSTPSSPTATSAGSAAASSRPDPTIRTRRPSTSATTSTTTPRPAPWPPSISSRTCRQEQGGVPRIMELDGRPGVKEVSAELMGGLGA